MPDSRVSNLPTAGSPLASDYTYLLQPGAVIGAKDKKITVQGLINVLRGVANGVASLGSDGKVPRSQRPDPDLFNVKDYGAVGDGTTDDTAAFHSARNAAGVNGTVVIPPSTYKVAALALNVAGQTWRFGPGAIIKLPASSTAEFFRITADSVTVDGGTFDGTGASASQATATMALAVNYATVKNATFLALPSAVNFRQCSKGVRIQNNRFYGCLKGAIYINNNAAAGICRDYWITDNYIDNSAATAAEAAIFVWTDFDANRCENLLIARNVIKLDNNANTATGGIITNRTYNFSVSDNSILNGGFMCMSIAFSSNGSISNNSMTNPHYTCIEINALTYVTIQGNTMDGLGTSTAVAMSMPGSGHGIVIDGNVVRGFNTDKHLAIASTASGIYSSCVMSNNQFYNDTAVASSQLIYLNDRIDNWIIEGNIFDNAGGSSGRAIVAFNASLSLKVIGNVFRNFSTCLLLAASTAVVIDGLSFTDNAMPGSTNGIVDGLSGGATKTLDPVAHTDGRNVTTGTTTGTKFGTATSQKLGFWNATPIVQPATNTDLLTALVNAGLHAGGTSVPLALGASLGAGTFVAIGATAPAASGALRLENNASIKWRNQANGADVDVLRMDTNNNMLVNCTGTAVLMMTGGTERANFSSSGLTLANGMNIVVNTSTGTKFATSASQKLGFWNATPIVQPTTAFTAATFVAGSGTAVNDASTFDGYTLKQVVAALRAEGLLA